MKKSEADEFINSRFNQILTPAGFINKKNDWRFLRVTPFGLQEIGYTLSDYTPMFRFAFFLCIRFDAVEDILNPVLSRPKEYWDVSRTVTLNLNFFVGKNLSFDVRDLGEIETAMTEVETILHGKVFPMLDSCNDFPALERLLNNQIVVSPQTNLDSVANAGVVAAALCRKDNFEEIVSRYRAAMIGYIEPIRLRFEAVVSYLRKNFFEM